jgi:hypothetical protein
VRATVKGMVVTQPQVRGVITSKKKKVRLASFEPKDDAGRINTSRWHDHATFAENLSVFGN